MQSLFQIVNEKASITDFTRTIWYYDNLIQKYGEDTACKLFVVFQWMVDLNPKTNPFCNTAEHEKQELIIRAVCPELDISIDWDDPEITECIELTRKLFETPRYRNYYASKILADRINEKIKSTYVDLTKMDGNTGEIKKAYDLFTAVTEQTDKIYKEYIDEQEEGMVQVRGGDKQLPGRNLGKSQNLE